MTKTNGLLKKITQIDERYLIVAIFLCAFFLRLIALLASQTHDIDFFRFFDRSSMVINGEISYQDFADPKPLWTYTLAAWLYLFGSTEFNASLLLIFVDLLGALVLLYIGKKIFGKKHGVLPCVVYSFLPFTVLLSSVEGKMDVFPLLFVLLSFLCLLKEKYFLSAIFLGIGIGYKYLAGLCLIPFLFYILGKKNIAISLKYIFVCGLSVFFVTLPFILIAPTKFIEDTLLFFVTRENTGYAFYHPYNFLPFFVPLIVVFFGIVLVMINGAKIRNFSYEDLISLLFFFIVITNLFNRVLFTQYFLYAIPFLCLMLTKFILEKKKWLFCIGFSMTLPLAMEYLNNFGFAISQSRITIETSDKIGFIGDVSVISFLWILIVTLFLFIVWKRELKKNKRLSHFFFK